MFGLNKVYLVGHLGSDPQPCLSKNGKTYAKLNLATQRSRKNENGNWDSLTDWHTVTAWGKQGEACIEHLNKGSKLMVEGYLSHFEFTTENGETRKQTGITAHNIEFFQKKNSTQAA